MRQASPFLFDRVKKRMISARCRSRTGTGEQRREVEGVNVLPFRRAG
jgi:hypothetical protein